MTVLLTIDTDWAPDYVIEDLHTLWNRFPVPVLVFATNQSTALDDWAADGLVEIGIHPNFDAGSSHGGAIDSILDHLLSIFPQARACRTHGNMVSTNILIALCRQKVIEYDFSLFAPIQPNLSPHIYSYLGSEVLRIPYNWEDSYVTAQTASNLLWSNEQLWSTSSSLQVLNFHPIHTFLNTSRYSDYIGLKKSLGPVHLWQQESVFQSRPRRAEWGARDEFLKTIELLYANPTWQETPDAIRKLTLQARTTVSGASRWET